VLQHAEDDRRRRWAAERPEEETAAVVTDDQDAPMAWDCAVAAARGAMLNRAGRRACCIDPTMPVHDPIIHLIADCLTGIISSGFK
jgi:hypothetical protein